MILNLSIGEEIEKDARQLEGKVVEQDSEISPAASHSGDLEPEKTKNESKVDETIV
jgi:hypothetical protein